MNDMKEAVGCVSARPSSQWTASKEINAMVRFLTAASINTPATNYVPGLKTSTCNNEIKQNQALEIATTAKDEIVPNATEERNGFDLNQAVGAILLEHILNEVIDETKKLQDEIKCQHSLLNCLNKVDLCFGFFNENFGTSWPTLLHNEAIVQAFDENGSGIDIISAIFDDSVVVERELVRLHLRDCVPIPLRKMGKGILLVSNQIAEIFYPGRHFAPEITILKKTGQLSYFLHLYGAPKTFQDDTEVCLVGQLEFLSQADKVTVENNTNEQNETLFLQYLLSGDGMSSPNAVFLPKLLKLARNCIQEHRLLANFFQTTSPTTAQNCGHTSHNFRHSIINAIGKESDVSLLRDNSKLKYKKEIISKVHDMIDSVVIDHDGGTIVLHISEGQLMTYNRYDHPFSIFNRRNSKEGSAWVLFVSDNAVAVYNNICSLKMTVSGIEMASAGFSAENPGYNGQGKVYHCFNLNVLVTSIQRSAEPRYALTEVVFSFGSIFNTLNALGIDP